MSKGRVRRAPIRSLLSAALPLLRTEEGILVCLITSRSTGRWIVPKGKRERGEELAECALREAHEEAGVLGRVEAKPIGMIRNEPGGPENVPLHLLEVAEVLDVWPECTQRRRVWEPPARAATLVDDPSLARVLRELKG